MRVDCAVRGADRLGECPLWDDRSRVLWWVDSRAPCLRRFDPSSGETRSIELPEVVGSFAFRSKGGMLVALKSGVYRFDPEPRALEAVARPESDQPENRFNDGRCDRAGRFWVGTMSDVRRDPTGALYRLAPEGTCTKIRSDVIVPNSIAWSPDDRTMYFADTYRTRIYAYDFDVASGAVRNERVLADTATHRGRPDGSCVDVNGCLWNGEYGGWRVVRYRPDGRVDREIAMPVANPTCCCFGGANLDILYVTSATQRLTPTELAEQPLAGSVFAFWPGVQGLPEARYAG